MRVRFFHIVAALSLLAVLSCRKETSVENPNGNAGTFMADIDGVQWVAADSLKSATILSGLINLTGISADNHQLSITLNDTIPGTYTLNQTSTSQAIYANNDSSDLYAYSTNQGADTTQAGGTVTVIEVDVVNKTITGTFSFNVWRDVDGRQKKLTNGIFYKLPYSSSLPPATSVDTMYASINGQNWRAQSMIGSALNPSLLVNGSALNGSQGVSLVMPLDIQPGIPYPMNYTGDYYGIYSPVVTSGFASQTGTLTVLENDPTNKRIRGNFSFTAVDPTGQSTQQYQVTGGYFSLQYQ